MQNISITRYAHPKAVGWAGYIEPEDRTWIMFIGLDGRPMVYLNRDPETGAVLPDDPEEREAHLATIRAEGGLRIAMKNDGSADFGPDYKDPHELGERIHPLGESGGGGDVVPLAKQPGRS